MQIFSIIAPSTRPKAINSITGQSCQPKNELYIYCCELIYSFELILQQSSMAIAQLEHRFNRFQPPVAVRHWFRLPLKQTTWNLKSKRNDDKIIQTQIQIQTQMQNTNTNTRSTRNTNTKTHTPTHTHSQRQATIGVWTRVCVGFGYRWLHINWKSKTIFQFAAFSTHTHTHTHRVCVWVLESGWQEHLKGHAWSNWYACRNEQQPNSLSEFSSVATGGAVKG